MGFSLGSPVRKREERFQKRQVWKTVIKKIQNDKVW
jgi:hypothetical protein